MTNFSPGPWNYLIEQGCHEFVSARGLVIRSTGPGDAPSMPDALLIKAAPKMYSLLLRMRDELDSFNSRESQWMADIDAVLAEIEDKETK